MTDRTDQHASEERPALLVLDAQNELVDAGGKVGGSGLAAIVAERGIVDGIARLLGTARSAGIPIAYTRLAYRADHADITSRAPRVQAMRNNFVAVAGSWGCEFPESIAPAPDDQVFDKQWVDPLLNTALVPWLYRNRITEVVLTGVATNLVVESAARHADDLGFAVTVVADCCASPNPAWHEFAVTNILPVFGRVAARTDVEHEWTVRGEQTVGPPPHPTEGNDQ